MIVLILAALIALVARVDAADAADAAHDDAIDLAIRYADALTGIASDPRRAPTLDAYDEDDEDDEVDEVDEMDEADGDEDEGDDAAAALRSDTLLTIDADRAHDEDADAFAGFANDALLAIDADRARDEDADALAGDPVAGNPVPADLDGEGHAENSEMGTGALALLDAELDPGDAMAGGDAVVAAAPAGAAELYEQSLRHQRPSPWGRLDVGVSLRRRWSEPMHAPASRRDEVWLVATWRR